jgi:signal transduction histidine kinase
MIAYIIIFTGIVNLILGTVVLFGSREKKGRLTFALLAFSTFLWSSADFFVYETGSAISDRIAFSTAALVPTFLLLWIYDLLGQSKKTLKQVTILFVGSFFVIAPLIDNLVITNIRPSNLTGTTEEAGSLFLPYMAFCALAYSIVLISLVRHYIASRDGERNRYRTILAGFLLYGAGSILFGLVLPAVGFHIFTNFDVACSLVFVGFTAYAIIEYRWMNIKLIAFQLLSIFIIGASLSELFIADTAGQRTYRAIMFVVLTTLSVLMVKSVLNEVKRKEELEVANKEISERKEQLQAMADSLATANDKLRKLDQARADFINIASHQLKKVPTPIKGYLSLLLEGSYGQIPTEQREVLNKINSANERQINLVDDLLNVARMESGRIKLDFKKQCMEDICREVYETLLPSAKEKGLELSYKEPKEALPELALDKGKIFEGIFNFVDNAIKYTVKGSVDLKIELSPESHYKPQAEEDQTKDSLVGPVVRVTVSDTGMGISKENIPYLFAKFSRKDVARVNSEGTGLGLYVVKLVIEAHGGRTWAESYGEGRGSTFAIEIPTKQQEGLLNIG